MAMIQTNRAALNVIVDGAGAPALVFSHGLLMDADMYAPQVSAFSPSRLCVRWDQRGHGRTRETGEPFSYWDSAGDLLAILDALNIDSAILVGLSQGGFLSMRAALLAPERVKGLVLLSTQAGVDSEEVYDNFRGLKAEWSANGPANAGAGLASMLIGDRSQEAAWVTKWRDEPRERLGPCLDALISRDDLTPRLADIQCPALVIHGDADMAIPPELGRKLADGLPDCRGFVLVPGAAHAPNLTHPAPVNRAIAQFIDTL